MLKEENEEEDAKVKEKEGKRGLRTFGYKPREATADPLEKYRGKGDHRRVSPRVINVHRNSNIPPSTSNSNKETCTDRAHSLAVAVMPSVRIWRYFELHSRQHVASAHHSRGVR